MSDWNGSQIVNLSETILYRRDYVIGLAAETNETAIASPSGTSECRLGSWRAVECSLRNDGCPPDSWSKSCPPDSW